MSSIDPNTSHKQEAAKQTGSATLTLHKTSSFSDEEVAGFLAAAEAGPLECELVWLTSSDEAMVRRFLKLLALFSERAKVVEEIGLIKRIAQLPIYEPKREELVFENVLQHNTGPLSEAAVRRLYERIIDEMRTLQRERMKKAQAEAAGEGERQ